MYCAKELKDAPLYYFVTAIYLHAGPVTIFRTFIKYYKRHKTLFINLRLII